MITQKVLERLKPQDKPYFLRSNRITGFAVKVNPSGTIRYIVETKHSGRSKRKTIGSYPTMLLKQAELEAVRVLRSIQHGYTEQKDLRDLLKGYLRTVTLKPNTYRNYKEVIEFYLNDWLSVSICSITKHMVEQRFTQIRDKGIKGGKPTHSQACKTMRILSALMNYAMADGLIESNPCDILKQKRIDRSVRRREHYLPTPKVRELLDKTTQESHPVTLALHLMLHTGLRKNEALRPKWEDLRDIEGVPCLLIGDTKNHRPHYVPITEQIQIILEKAQNDSMYIFQSTQRKGHYVNDVRPTLRRLAKLIDMEFRCHDLRRTFATRASEVHIDYLMIKRMLNHKSNDITGQYIQWNSRQNLLVMRNALEKINY